EFKTETNNTLIIKDTNDFLGVCKEIFNLDIEINDTIVKTIIPFIENEFSNFKKIIIDDNEFQIKEMEINPEETIQQDLGENLDITFSFIIKYLDSNKITEINDLCKTISINKKTKRFEVVKNYNYEVLE
ncbi:MAG: hypothetical protein KKF89_03950, partial [Nanoarchaeota archaeon]|nr:hypothetical protein [Nanoarchaeota archaeon]